MRILLIGRFFEEGFATFIGDELIRLGHEVVCYDPGPPLLAMGSRMRFYINRATSLAYQAAIHVRTKLGLEANFSRLRRVIEKHGAIDLTLVTHDYLSPSDADGVKRLTKAPLVLWYPDPIWSFRKHMFLNGPYDCLFFKDPYIVDMLRRKIGAPVYYLPECYSPQSLQPGVVSEEISSSYSADICTAGNLYAYRVAFYRNLADKNVRIWGLPAPLWMRLGDVKPFVENRFVAHNEKAMAFQGAKIVLNNLNPAEIWGTNVRTFEVCGAGGFQLVDWRPGLSQLFEIGRELVAFDDVGDLRAKIDHYLAAPEERRTIAAAGHRRALRDHTYSHRLSLLLATVDGIQKGYPEPSVGWAGRHAG
ncbi:MAG: spore maturation protein CgeB [Hyphomicrobiaceae bacterium]